MNGDDWARLRNQRNLLKHAVRRDTWDARDWDRVSRNITELKVATGELVDVTPTGEELMADVFALLFKAGPELADRGEMDPGWWMNHTVAGESRELNDYTTLRRFTRGDEVGSALGCSTMEPEIEALVDRSHQRRAQAEALQAKLDALAAAAQEKIDVDEMIQRWLDDHEGKPVPDDLAEQADSAAAAADQLDDEARRMAQDFEEATDADASTIRGSMALAMNRAADRARAEAQIAAAVWGTEPGQLKRVPVQERMDMARKLDNQRLRKIAEKFGAIHNLSMTDRMHVNPMMADEIVGVTLGNDLLRVVPSEFVKLLDPVRKYEFYRDFAARTLLEFEVTGTERVSKGGIIMTEDGSGSMAGEKEMWAKAWMLNLLDIARSEARAFHLIHHGSARELYPIDFSSPEMFTTERIFEAIEVFFDGGTDFEAPLTMAVDRLQAEFLSTGRVSGDIVMITDGECGVSKAWLQWFHEEQERLGFTTWGIILGHQRDFGVLWQICKGNVRTVRDLLSGSDARDILVGI